VLAFLLARDLSEETAQEGARGEDTSRGEKFRLLASTLLGVLWVTTPPLFGFWILAEIGSIGDWLRGLGGPIIVVGSNEIALGGLVVYALLFMLCSGVGILPTYAQAILGGWIFGFWLGTPAALIGFTGGAAIGWLICRLISRDAVVNWIDRKPKWSAVRHAFVEEGFWRTLGIVILIRVPPNSPFSLTNLAMSAGGARPVPYLLGTLIGMTPRTAIACLFAAAAAADGSKDIQSFVRDKGFLPIVIGVAMMVVVFVILAKVANRAMVRVLPADTNGLN
jgi:uncharacterized membrane protein YdjX (TVP38/TMEM64 family)